MHNIRWLFHIRSHTRMKITLPAPITRKYFSARKWRIGKCCCSNVLWYNFLLRRTFLHWIFPWLKRAYGDACVVTSSVRQWVKHFKGGNTDLNNQACSGHAQTALFWVTTQRVVVISDISGQPIGPILRVHESKRKPVAPNKVYAGNSMDSEKHQ